MIKIQIIYDNTSTKDALQADWGFAALIQAYDKTMLYDSGGNGKILLNNMRQLNIDPKDISDVFISHCHFDHIGGLSHFLNENSAVTLHAPTSFRGVRYANDVIYYDKPQQIFKHFYTSGELESIEQSLAIETDKGLLVIVGCSHPLMNKIFGALSPFGKIYGIIGGLHGFNDFGLFKDLQLICPTHCTQHKKEIKQIYSEQYIEGGAGKVIEL